ncbi:MAG: hypothetical protein M3076_17165 [Actinomycetota bacterium]|nr:hypothetical protein [Actinomycetota bacterium]
MYVALGSSFDKTFFNDAAANTVGCEPPAADVVLVGVEEVVGVEFAVVCDLVELELLDPHPTVKAETPIAPATAAARLTQVVIGTELLLIWC